MTPTTPQYRRERLETYKTAIDSGEVLPGYDNMAKQISSYDQLCMIDRDLCVAEEQMTSEAAVSLIDSWMNRKKKRGR